MVIATLSALHVCRHLARAITEALVAKGVNSAQSILHDSGHSTIAAVSDIAQEGEEEVMSYSLIITLGITLIGYAFDGVALVYMMRPRRSVV